MSPATRSPSRSTVPSASSRFFSCTSPFPRRRGGSWKASVPANGDRTVDKQQNSRRSNVAPNPLERSSMAQPQSYRSDRAAQDTVSDPDIGYVIGVDLGGTNLRLALADM